jgi:hypothetical protein
MTGIFIPFERMSANGWNIDFTSKIAGKIAKMRALFNDRTGAEDANELRYLIIKVGHTS